ncbi:zinc finger protein 469 [Tiliqua scincoides]|uniref:zinc finger protein 469 n=1 Tax=Tiliqua scincoides TaxID=71010 RepID=UPI0034636EB8
MGETQQVYALSESEPCIHDKDVPFEQLAKKDMGEFDSGLLGSSESCLHSGSEHGPHFTGGVKDKESHSQREAVIRPQQAGKIDFKSLHNRPKFPGSGSWGTVKGSPQSPTGKSRAREKSRRAGKGERGHQQLYRLTISNARPNPTIGIAYPQQKVTPPKKVDMGRGPVSGSYRFHVPSVPEREAELQQEELGFARCFPESPSSHIPSNYTSAAAAARPTHSAKLQPPAGVLHENPSSNGQLHYMEFQGNGSHSWPLPDKSLPGASSELPASKPCSFPESSKPSMHCLGPLPFQYPFQPLRNSAADPFQGKSEAQDYVDVSLAASQASHGAFAFHSSSRDWKEEALGSGHYDNTTSPEGRAYGLAPPPSQFLPSQAQGPLPCYKGRNEHSTDPTNGALSPPGAINQTPSTFQENQAVFPHSLHVSSMPKPVVGKRQSSSKDNVASPRVLDPGSSLRRNVPQVSLPQVHFQNKPYTEPPAGGISPSAGPFEKSLPATAQAHPRLLQAWEGGKRPYSPLEASSTPYLNPIGSQLSFGCHLGPELRQQHRKKAWQHLHLTSAMPGQNRIELSRKLASQKLPFPLGASEWEGSSKVQKGGTSYPDKMLLTGEGTIIQRHDPAPQSSANTFCFEGAKETEPPPGCGSRSKALYFGMGQTGPQAPSRLPSSSALALPSPSNSPLPSPAPNPTSSSTCSSLSPLSSSPTSHSFEDSVALASSPYFHPQCHPKDGNKPFHASEPLNSGSVHYQAADSIKPFQLSQDAPKDKLFYKGLAVDSHFHKPTLELSKGCLESFEAELPPPPYSSHHLLASSLSSASLDQLDVFLTCKQCDQNFSNLSSFLEHRQFCSSHVALQGLTKDSSRGTEVRRQQHHLHSESMKHMQTGQGLLLPSDLHVQLLPLNKTLDFLADGEGKGEAKEDPLKGTQLGSMTTNPLPLSTSDLEIDDAKLDSLITEALNGLEYQSDNPEIDSSFIDVFADEELASVKIGSSGAPHKAKEGLASGKKAKHRGMEESMKAPNCCDDHSSGDLTKSRACGKQHGLRDGATGWFPEHGDGRLEKQNSMELAGSKATDPGASESAQTEPSSHLKAGRKPCGSSFSPLKQATRPVLEMKQPKNMPCAGSPVSRLRPTAAGDTKLFTRDSKKRKLRSSSWSKELIHKIVQQKNKLHKRHSRSSKGMPLPLLADRLLPETKDNRFGEYEYISESDEEQVEYAKQHCRRKLGSRLSGRLRSGFVRRSQGRGGREKEKEPAWRYGQRKREEPKKAIGKDPGRREDCCAGRVRRRSSQSSTGSRQSTSLSSETSTSPQSTERADSDTEKESEQRGRHLQSPKCIRPLPREPLNVPGEEMVGRSHNVAPDLSRADSAKILPSGFRAHQRGSPDLSPISYTHGDEGLPQAQGSPSRSKEMPGRAPNTPSCAENSEQQYHGSLSHGNNQAKASPKELDPCALGINPHWRQFTASSGEALEFPVEEFISPSSTDNHGVPSEDSTSYEKGDTKFLKKQKDVTPPISCFSDNLVGLGIIEKRSDTVVSTADTFYDCSELSSSYESSGLFPGPPATEQPHSSDSMYFCQEDTDLSSCKQKHTEIPPYEASNEHRKVSMPLSFDSSPVFGELPVAEFDATLYEGMTSSKDNYVPFACASHHLGKMIPFDQQYSSFLHEKDWTIMDEVPPVLPDDIAQFHTLTVEKPLAKKYGVGGQMPLPERMANYAVPFMNGISDDELEIKRLVTELERQLQTSKLSMEASSEHQTSKDHASLERKEASSQFSPLTLDQESDGKALFLMESGFENANLVSPKACICENQVNEKTLLPPLDSNHRDPWPCPVPYSPLHSTAAELILVGPFSSKEAHDKMHENLQDVDISREDNFREIQDVPPKITPDSCLPNVADNIEAPSYSDNLIQSPDPLFPKTLEEAGLSIHETLPARTDAFLELPQKEPMFADPADLGPFSHPITPCLKREFELQEVGDQVAESNLTVRTQNSKIPEERLLCKTMSPEMLGGRTAFQKDKDGPALLEDADESSPACQTTGLHDKADDGKTLLFDSLTFSKEIGGNATPLQQLQLFVARTVKHNEEDLLIPCFSVLHSTTHLPPSAHVQPKQEEEATDNMLSGDVADSPTFEEGKGSMGELESVAKASSPTKTFLEPDEQVEHLDEKVSYTLEPPGLQGSNQHQDITEQQHVKDECSEMGDINRCADGPSPEHGHLSPLSNSMGTSLPREKGTSGTQVTDEVDEEQRKATLAFNSCLKSTLSTGLFEKEAPDCVLPAALRIHVAGCTSWGEASCEAKGVCTVKAHQTDEFGDQLGQLQCNFSLDPTNPPVNQYQDDFLLHQTSPVLAEDGVLDKQASHHIDTSQDSFPVEPGSADQECEQAENVAHADFGASQSEGAHQYSSSAERAVLGDPIQSSSEHKEWKEGASFTPSVQCCGDSTNLPSNAVGSLQQCLAEDTPNDLAELQSNVLPQSATSLHSDLSVTLLDMEGDLNLQDNNCNSPSMLPFKHQDFSEGPPKSPVHEDSEICSVRIAISSSQLDSLQGIVLGQSPSGTDSAPLTDARISKNVESTLNSQGAREVETGPQEHSEDHTQPEICRKNVGLQEMPAISLTASANSAEGRPCTRPFPEITELGPNMASQESNWENKDSKQSETVEEFSSCVKLAENKSGKRKEDSKTRQLKDKDRNGLPVTCDICSAPFRSKTGLMRHRAVKHQKKESTLLPDTGFAPLETSKRASRKNRKVFKEKTGSSHISNTAVERPFPKPYRRQRKEPSAEIQEVISKVLSDISCDITHDLQSTTQLSKEMDSKQESLQAASMEEATPKSGREPKSGVKGNEPSASGSGSFAKKKVKRKVRKGKRKGMSSQNEITRSSYLENKSSGVRSQASPSTATHIPATELESSSTSAGDQPQVQSPLLPCPLKDNAPEGETGGTPSAEGTAGPPPLLDGRSCKGQREMPGSGERLHTQKAWPSVSTKQAEEGLSNICEKQHKDAGVKEMEGSLLKEACCRNSNSPLIDTASPKRLQQSCGALVDLKDFPEVMSGVCHQSSDGVPCPVDSTPWKMGEFGPRNGSGGDGAAGPDLQSLLDDDSTFSQLFPRNDQFARRKCTRVYGKRNKKPKPVAEVSARPEAAADLFTIRMASDLGETSSFCVTQEDPCEYETISVDDALTPSVCLGGKAVMRNASPSSAKTVPLPTESRQQEDLTESTDGSTFNFLYQKSPMEGCPDLSCWSGLEEKAKGVSADGTLLSPSTELTHSHSTEEANSETPELQKECYNPPVNEDQGSPGFHTVDMETLSTKFEMRDAHFYSIGEDHLSNTDECTLGFKSLSVPQGRGTKNKLDEGKQGKARGDLNLKTKDKQYKCKVCFQWFLTLGELDFHKLTHNPSPPPTCYMCVQRKFSSREQLRDHLKEKHAKNKAGLWACGMCLKEISDVWMYNEHLREHATQFARKGQAQKSVLGLPGCFGEDEEAVTHFLNSIMCRKLSKSSKRTEAVGKGPSGKEGKSLKEPTGPDAKASKEPSESLLRTKPAAAFPKAPAVLSPDPTPKGEAVQRLAPMHPECKDPSRDCHHCGKQFPKPFKLQRHLVVHSLQKIYLCPKCPMFYQETKELRGHLSQEHGTAEEADIKHTTLYACELCADVMHVIKKSFICSTCNYTFSKKEQYDRHMEKHLVGSNKTFRFRGVTRPGITAKDEDRKVKVEAPPREGTPVAKKKKLVHHSNWLAQGCASAPQQGAEPLLPPSESLPTRPPAQTSVKAEDLAGDISLLAEMEKGPFDFLSLSPPTLVPQDRASSPELKHIAPLSMVQPAKGDSLDENPPPFLDSSDAVSIDLTGLAHKQVAERKLSPPHLSEKHKQAAFPEVVALSSRVEHATVTWDAPPLQEEPVSLLPELSVAGLEAAQGKGSPNTHWSSSPPLNDPASEDCIPMLHLPEAAFHMLPLKDKELSPALNQSAKESPSKKVTGAQAQSENVTSTRSSPDSGEEAQRPPSLEDKASPELGAHPKDNRPSMGIKETGSNQIKPVSSQLRGAGTQAKHNPPDLSKSQDRSVANGLAKLHPKKRKEHKSSHRGSSASRENIVGDGGKKKKIRTPDTMRNDGAGGLRRADWSNGEALALSPRRRDTHCNKLTCKPKMPTVGGQLKKIVPDPCFPKKGEIRHANGDLKRKKDILGSKTFHHLLTKDPSTSLPSSFNKHRTVQGAKLPDSHNYRTAESQNNLLSQLFGQKLTSFKIPLRRDTSE